MDARIAIGLVLGLAGVPALLPPFRDAPPRHGPLLPDSDGALQEIVIQYVPEAEEIVTTAYREFLGALPAAVTVRVVCPDREAFDDLVRRVGAVACGLEPVLTGHPMTTWARDRWLALSTREGDGALLLCPAVEAGENVWPARAGDRRIGDDLAAALPHVDARRSGLVFDGGDFVADGETVFVSPRVARRNPGLTTAELHRRLAKTLECEVILLRHAPNHHAGMYLMTVGRRTALVGDPSLARDLVGDDAPNDPDWSAATQAEFDAVAETAAGAGYRVVRIPVVPGRDGRTWLTGINVILDGRAVYLPVFRGVERLNRASAGVWRSLGFTVRPVDCTETYRHFGSLRCLVNVLRRSRSRGPAVR
ncbi:MAG: agmatine deiminase family protein [Planctomycetota bacterium]|jgi:N-dimethylarginine dimethylaminohydrolase